MKCPKCSSPEFGSFVTGNPLRRWCEKCHYSDFFSKTAAPDKIYLNGIITGAVAMLVMLILVFGAIILTAKWRV